MIWYDVFHCHWLINCNILGNLSGIFKSVKAYISLQILVTNVNNILVLQCLEIIPSTVLLSEWNISRCHVEVFMWSVWLYEFHNYWRKPYGQRKYVEFLKITNPLSCPHMVYIYYMTGLKQFILSWITLRRWLNSLWTMTTSRETSSIHSLKGWRRVKN